MKKDKGRVKSLISIFSFSTYAYPFANVCSNKHAVNLKLESIFAAK